MLWHAPFSLPSAKPEWNSPCWQPEDSAPEAAAAGLGVGAQHPFLFDPSQTTLPFRPASRAPCPQTGGTALPRNTLRTKCGRSLLLNSICGESVTCN